MAASHGAVGFWPRFVMAATVLHGRIAAGPCSADAVRSVASQLHRGGCEYEGCTTMCREVWLCEGLAWARPGYLLPFLKDGYDGSSSLGRPLAG